MGFLIGWRHNGQWLREMLLKDNENKNSMDCSHMANGSNDIKKMVTISDITIINITSNSSHEDNGHRITNTAT